MAASVETMMFVGREKPWHGLGTMVETAPDSREALIAAGLDWDVVQKPVFTQDGAKIPGYFANVRFQDNAILGVVINRYKVVQNREAFAFTDELLGNGVRYETAGSIKVRNQMLNRWKISEETLKTDAQVNTPLLQPAKICTLGHMICKLMGDKNMEQDSEELGFDIREALEESNQVVLTNRNGINGFGAVLYDNCLYDIAERYGVEKLHLSCSNTKSYTTCLQAYIL